MNANSSSGASVVAAVRFILQRSCRYAPPVIAGLALTSAAAQDVDSADSAVSPDVQTLLQRQDIVHLPAALKNVLATMAGRPNTYSPARAFAEADSPASFSSTTCSTRKNFQPNIFTAIVPGINDHAIPTAANAANPQLPTMGAVRVVLEPKPGSADRSRTIPRRSSTSSPTSRACSSSTTNPAGTRAG